MYFPALHTSSLIHCLRSVVRNRAIGRRLGGERKGSCGRNRGVRVFWVKSRGELGGRYGLRKSILRIGSRGRIVVGVDGVDAFTPCVVDIGMPALYQAPIFS